MLEKMFDSIAIMWALACFKTRSLWLNEVDDMGEDVEARKKEVTDKAVGWWVFITTKAKDMAEKRINSGEVQNPDGPGGEMFDLITFWCRDYFTNEDTRKNLEIEFELSEFVDMKEDGKE